MRLLYTNRGVLVARRHPVEEARRREGLHVDVRDTRRARRMEALPQRRLAQLAVERVKCVAHDHLEHFLHAAVAARVVHVGVMLVEVARYREQDVPCTSTPRVSQAPDVLEAHRLVRARNQDVSGAPLPTRARGLRDSGVRCELGKAICRAFLVGLWVELFRRATRRRLGGLVVHHVGRCACCSRGGTDKRTLARRRALRRRIPSADEGLESLEARLLGKTWIQCGVVPDADVLGILHCLRALRRCPPALRRQLHDRRAAAATAAMPLGEIRERACGPILAAPPVSHVRGASEACGLTVRGVESIGPEAPG
mmetsp:Transcript_79359/g.220819  ORF Transcript_79359/g.220819 Transcript_79359/m.220819 type:complete len:311 (+) Transcript_79359:145-1077(+)